MKVIMKYYKHSTTGELIKKQIFEGCSFNSPDYYYDLYGRQIEDDVDLTGFLEIKEKKWDLYRWRRWIPTNINSWLNPNRKLVH